MTLQGVAVEPLLSWVVRARKPGGFYENFNDSRNRRHSFFSHGQEHWTRLF